MRARRSLAELRCAQGTVRRACVGRTTHRRETFSRADRRRPPPRLRPRPVDRLHLAARRGAARLGAGRRAARARRGRRPGDAARARRLEAAGAFEHPAWAHDEPRRARWFDAGRDAPSPSSDRGRRGPPSSASTSRPARRWRELPLEASPNGVVPLHHPDGWVGALGVGPGCSPSRVGPSRRRHGAARRDRPRLGRPSTCTTCRPTGRRCSRLRTVDAEARWSSARSRRSR